MSAMTIDKVAALKRTALFKELDEFTLNLVAQHAARVGSVREVVSRALSRLQQDGLIVLEDRKLTIPNVEALSSFARS